MGRRWTKYIRRCRRCGVRYETSHQHSKFCLDCYDRKFVVARQ